MLLRDLLLELELRLLPLALGLLLFELELLLRPELLLPLEAVPRLLLREEDEPDFEEEEDELRDAIACSLGRLISLQAVASEVAAATTVNLGRWVAETVGMTSASA